MNNIDTRLNFNSHIEQPASSFIAENTPLDQVPQCGTDGNIEFITTDDPNRFDMFVCKPLGDQYILDICNKMFDGRATPEDIASCNATFAGKEGLISFDTSTQIQKDIVNRLAMSIVQVELNNRIENVLMDNIGSVVTVTVLATAVIGLYIKGRLDSAKKHKSKNGSNKNEETLTLDVTQIGDVTMLNSPRQSITEYFAQLIVNQFRGIFNFESPEDFRLVSGMDEDLNEEAQRDLDLAMEREERLKQTRGF